MLNGWQVEFTGMGEPWKNKQFGNAKYHKQTSNLNSANSKRVAEDNFIQTKAFFPFSTKEQTRLWHRGHWDSNIFNSFIRDVNFKILRCLVLKLYYSQTPGGVATTRHRPLTTEGQKRIRKSQKGKINKNGTKKAQIRQIQGRRAYAQKEE